MLGPTPGIRAAKTSKVRPRSAVRLGWREAKDGGAVPALKGGRSPEEERQVLLWEGRVSRGRFVDAAKQRRRHCQEEEAAHASGAECGYGEGKRTVRTKDRNVAKVDGEKQAFACTEHFSYLIFLLSTPHSGPCWPPGSNSTAQTKLKRLASARGGGRRLSEADLGTTAGKNA